MKKLSQRSIRIEVAFIVCKPLLSCHLYPALVAVGLSLSHSRVEFCLCFTFPAAGIANWFQQFFKLSPTSLASIFACAFGNVYDAPLDAVYSIHYPSCTYPTALLWVPDGLAMIHKVTSFLNSHQRAHSGGTSCWSWCLLMKCSLSWNSSPWPCFFCKLSMSDALYRSVPMMFWRTRVLS